MSVATAHPEAALKRAPIKSLPAGIVPDWGRSGFGWCERDRRPFCLRRWRDCNDEPRMWRC